MEVLKFKKSQMSFFPEGEESKLSFGSMNKTAPTSLGEGENMFGKTENTPDIPKDFKGDIKVKSGKYRVANSNYSQNDFEKLLDSYGTHSGLMKSALPEHQGIADKINELHTGNEDEIRDTFNKTTGRWQKLSDKPQHLVKSPKEMLMSSDGLTNEHYAVPDLSDNLKKEMDSFTSERHFDRAVKKGEISPELTKYLRSYNADHYNPGRSRVMYDKGKWKDAQDGDASPIESFWKHPVSSNKASFTANDKAAPLEDSLDLGEQTSLFGNEGKYSKVKNEAGVQRKKFDEGESFEYAGQNHKVLKNGNVSVKTMGDDGIVRDIKKDDINHVQHEPYEFDPLDSKLFNKLTGRNKEQGFDDIKVNHVDDVPTELKTKLKQLGVSDEDIVTMHNYFAAKKPREDQFETGKKARTGLDQFDSSDDRPRFGSINSSNVNPDEDFKKKKEDYDNTVSSYLDTVGKYKDKFQKEFHPYKNPSYDVGIQNPREARNAHKLNTINRDSIVRAFRKSDENLTSNDIAGRLGIKHNSYVQNEIENTLKDLFNEGYLHKSSKGNRMSAQISAVNKGFAHKSKYHFLPIKSKKDMEAINLQEEKITTLIKSLSIPELWNKDGEYTEGVKDYVRLVVAHASGNSAALPHYSEGLLKKSIIASEINLRKTEVIKSIGWEEINKALPSESYFMKEVKDVDNS